MMTCPVILHTAQRPCHFQFKVYVSAGVRGMQLCLNAEDLVEVCNGTVCSVATEI